MAAQRKRVSVDGDTGLISPAEARGVAVRRIGMPRQRLARQRPSMRNTVRGRRLRDGECEVVPRFGHSVVAVRIDVFLRLVRWRDDGHRFRLADVRLWRDGRGRAQYGRIVHERVDELIVF